MSIEEILKIIKENEQYHLSEDAFKLEKEVPSENLSSLKEFIKWFIDSANAYGSNGTIYVHNNESQCRPGANRSTGDIFILCRYYFPDCTLEDVIFHLVELNETKLIETLHCGDIDKRVWYRTTSTTREYVTSDYDRSNSYRINKQTNGLSYNELKQFYEYTTEKESAAC